MKSITTCILTFFTSASLFSQTVPNGSFEDWHTTVGVLEPDFWNSSPELVLLGGNPMVERSTDAHSGSYSAKIVTPVITILGETTSTRGILTNDNAFPLSGRPDSVVVWLKYIPDGNHVYALRADLIAWDAQQQTEIPVALGTYIGGLTPEFTRVSFHFSYSSAVMPDSVIFTFYNDFGDEIFGVNTALWVDDVSLIYPEDLTTNEVAKPTDKLFPVPANDILHVQTTTQTGSWSIYDTEGRCQLIVEQKNSSDFQIDIRSLANGFYLLKSPNGTVAKFEVQQR